MMQNAKRIISETNTVVEAVKQEFKDKYEALKAKTYFAIVASNSMLGGWLLFEAATSEEVRRNFVEFFATIWEVFIGGGKFLCVYLPELLCVAFTGHGFTDSTMAYIISLVLTMLYTFAVLPLFWLILKAIDKLQNVHKRYGITENLLDRWALVFAVSSFGILIILAHFFEYRYINLFLIHILLFVGLEFVRYKHATKF